MMMGVQTKNVLWCPGSILEQQDFYPCDDVSSLETQHLVLPVASLLTNETISTSKSNALYYVPRFSQPYPSLAHASHGNGLSSFRIAVAWPIDRTGELPKEHPNRTRLPKRVYELVIAENMCRQIFLLSLFVVPSWCWTEPSVVIWCVD